MEKHKIIIITIISTLLSLIFVLVSYFGINRYLSLHWGRCDSYIREYSKLPKANNKRVIISFTTTPDKLDKIKPMINSILDQTVRVNQILLVFPYKYKDYKYVLPKYLKDTVNVFPIGREYGKGTKLIPVLLREKESDTIIIALDDNIVYGKDFVETMIDESNKNPGNVLVDKSGAILVKPEYFECNIIDRENDNCDIKWIIDKAKNKWKVINYIENYRSFNK